ncbi:MAG: flagellar hook-basal body complex protein FliE [Burkholderiaceae bacterium]
MPVTNNDWRAKMDIGSLTRLQLQLQAAQRRGMGQTSQAPSGGEEAASFGNVLDVALKKVSSQQNETADLQRRFQAGDSSVGLEQTMVSMQKSQIAFQAALTVRNRLVGAYTEIMNMQV